MESKILSSIIKDKESFNRLSKLNVKDSFSDPAKFIYDIVCDFYDKDMSATEVDLELVEKRIARELPKQIDLYRNILKTLEGTTSSANLIEEVIAMKKDAIARELSSLLLTQKRSGVLELMESYKDVELSTQDDNDEDESLLVSASVSDVVESLTNKNRIRMWPKALNEATGGAIRGNNVLVFGRPEVGKSLFIINMVGGLLHDGYKVLFIENEDPAKSTMSRLICRLAEKPIVDVIDNPDKVEDVVKQKGYDNLILKSLSPGTFKDIQSLIDQHGVDVVIINQLRNIWVGKESRVEQMEIAATSARNLAKKNDILVIGVTQAGDSGTNKLRLDMGDIDFSNTGMPAQMDLIIGVGSNDEYDSKSWRMISLPKNKLSGEHVYFPVLVDTKINKVKSV